MKKDVKKYKILLLSNFTYQYIIVKNRNTCSVRGASMNEIIISIEKMLMRLDEEKLKYIHNLIKNLFFKD